MEADAEHRDTVAGQRGPVACPLCSTWPTLVDAQNTVIANLTAVVTQLQGLYIEGPRTTAMEPWDAAEEPRRAGGSRSSEEPRSSRTADRHQDATMERQTAAVELQRWQFERRRPPMGSGALPWSSSSAPPGHGSTP